MSDPAREPLEYATPTRRSRRRIAVWITLFVLIFLIGVAIPIALHRSIVRYTAVGTVTVLPPVHVPAVPSRLTIVQRTSQVLPGTNGTITARIGDITGGQTLLSVDDANGQPLVATTSMSEGDTQRFTVGTATFVIELLELKNFLTGDDFAVFELRHAGTGLSEEEKIRRLIDAVAGAPGVTFIRNGSPHDAAEAAAHLARKYEAAGQKEMTARQFIEQVASRSSLSGEPYLVRLSDGTELAAGEWLAARLREMEASPPAEGR